MWQIGVWERDEGVAERVSRMAGGCSALGGGCRQRARRGGFGVPLLVVPPGATGWAGAGALQCRTALLPGGRAALTRALPADTLISYGPSGRNTLTLSSLDELRASVAVQREFTALDGRTVERQELVLPYDGRPPELLLAEAGAALLLGKLAGEG